MNVSENSRSELESYHSEFLEEHQLGIEGKPDFLEEHQLRIEGNLNFIEEHQLEDTHSEIETYASKSISYSPLCSQFSFTGIEDQTILNKESKTSGSSLHFLAKNSKNLADISTIRDIDNITFENLKSSSEKRSEQTTSSESKRKKRVRRFIPPKKLTRKEIQEEFDEQDRKIYEASINQSDFSKYLSQILNRPSVRQVQNSKHLALVRKTDDGVEVIPAKPEPKKTKFSFKRNLSSTSTIDMSIFSDKNAKRFDEFLNSDERDLKRFKFNFGSQKKNEDFNFQPQSISEYAAAAEKTPFVFPSQNTATSTDNFVSLTPDGFYKQNKADVDNIVNKYLQPENIFETCPLNEQDFDL